MSDALRFDGVSKRYGRFVALDALSFRVPQGALCGFIGPNGAGKTTSFSLVAGFCRADAGEITVLDGPGFDPWRLRGRLGVLPQDADLGDRHTPREFLDHLGRLQGMGRAVAARSAEQALDRVQLADRRDRTMGSLSHGMRRRVAVASALIGDPDLVLLDEPTAGLDPVQAGALREVLVRRRPGQTVVISSHQLDELERICDWIVMIDRGRCLRSGTVAEVTDRGLVVSWRFASGPPVAPFAARLPDHRFVADGDELRQSAPPGADLDASARVIAEVSVGLGLAIREVRRGVSLEQRFLADQQATPPREP